MQSRVSLVPRPNSAMMQSRVSLVPRPNSAMMQSRVALYWHSTPPSSIFAARQWSVFIRRTLRDYRTNYVNQICADIPLLARLLPAAITIHAILIIAPQGPHYLWHNAFGAKLDFSSSTSTISSERETRQPASIHKRTTSYLVNCTRRSLNLTRCITGTCSSWRFS